MKNKTTYEMDDIMGLITRDLEEKGLEPDSASVEIWARVDGARISVKEIEIEANVSWVGVPAQEGSRGGSARSRHREAEPDDDTMRAPADLLDEAPSPRNRPTLAIGDIGEPPGTVEDITTASTKIARAGGAGPFSPDRVKRRLSDDESTDYPGTTPRGR